MPEGTLNYRIFEALDRNASFDLFQSFGLFDEPSDQEHLELENSDLKLTELNF